MAEMVRPIEEKVLGEVIMGMAFHDGATDPEYLNKWYRAAVYVCPPDRRAIVKDVRLIWNPDRFNDLASYEPGDTGAGAKTGDKRVMELRVGRTVVARTEATDTDKPDAIMFPNFMGGSAASFVLNPGDVLEVALLIWQDNNVGDAYDYVIARAQGVEVNL